MRQRRVGGFQCDICATAHCDPNGGSFHRWRVVNTITDHRQRRMLIQLGHRFNFIFRQEARFKFQPQFPGDCRCCAWIIAGEDHPFDTQRVQFTDSSCSIGAQGILQRNDTQHVIITYYQHYRLPGAFQFINQTSKCISRMFSGSAYQHALTVNLRFNARPDQRPL